MDAVRVTAVAAAFLTALGCAGCSVPQRQPAGMPPPPAYVQRVPTLRVGLPSRGNLLFTCGAPVADPRLGSAVYALDSLALSGLRWRRVQQATPDSSGALAPDTLIVSTFDDAIDEEIALERGDLDVAVFWPGEISARMRSDARFGGPELGLRARGVLACVAGAGDTLGVQRADMEVLNREAFAGDLMPWSWLEAGPGDAPPARYVVDRTVPGSKHLERILARIPSVGVTRTLKLVYVDQPVAGATTSGWRTPGVTPLFALRCPVLARPEARSAVRRIGAGAFADLAPCASGTRP